MSNHKELLVRLVIAICQGLPSLFRQDRTADGYSSASRLVGSVGLGGKKTRRKKGSRWFNDQSGPEMRCEIKAGCGNESSAGEAEPALLALAAAAVALITVLGWLQPAVHSSTWSTITHWPTPRYNYGSSTWFLVVFFVICSLRFSDISFLLPHAATFLA